MFRFLQTQKKPLIGVDMSSSPLKILELSGTHNQCCIESIREENIEALDGKVKSRYAVMAVSGSSVFSRVIQMNKVFNDFEINEQIEIEVERYIPYPLEEVYYDFEVLGPSHQHPDLIDVLFAAAQLETVNTKRVLLEKAGLKVGIVDLEIFAMERAFAWVVKQLPEKGIHKRVALINIGATFISLYVFYNLQMRYVCDYAWAGTYLLEEIQRILQAFLSSSEETDIQYFVLSGEIDLILGLEDLLVNQFGREVFIANPFLGMQISKEVNLEILKNSSSFMLACGLALRNFD